jgi:iron complex transport system ATP-binding protein
MIETESAGLVINGRTILHPLSLKLKPGHVTGIIGANGAGKSSLLSLLAGDRHPSTGRVVFEGKPLVAWRPRPLARRRAVITQHPAAEFAFTVRDILEMGRLPHGDAAAPELLQEVARTAGIDPLLNRIYPTLSGGERQRVHVARALLQLASPPQSELPRSGWLLLDEPTSHMDLGHAAEILAWLRALSRRGIGVGVVLHDLSLASTVDRLLLLARGALVADGDAASVLASPALDQAYETTLDRLHHPDGRLIIVPATTSAMSSTGKIL